MSTIAGGVELPDPHDETSVLNFTQAMRAKAVATMCATGVAIDTDSITNLTKMLDGMDRAALGRLRIKVDAKNGAANAQAVELVAAALQSKLVQGIYEIPDVVGKEKQLGQIEETFEALPGEFNTGVSSQTYSEFMSKMLPDEDK